VQQHSEPLVLFTHVQKAGGTTIEAVMRRNLGIRHMIVDPPLGWIYQERDLRVDLRLNPFTRSLCSHWLRPFVHFGALEARLVWYTILRNPIDRYLSHYQHHVEQMGSTQCFEDWLREPIQKNWQTQLLAGEQDLLAARQILASRYRCVALLERFDESLLMIRDRLGLGCLDLRYGRPRNVARSNSLKQMIQEKLEKHRDQVMENNRLDLELYDFAAREVFPRQIREYGEDRLRRDLRAEFGSFEADTGDRLRERSNVLYRRAVYKPVWALRRLTARLHGVPDVRR
jgi:hypothetical protein